MMNIPEELRKIAKPGEKTIAFDPESGRIHVTDFTPAKTPRDDAANITEVVDAKTEKDVYFVVSAAMGRPGNIVESDCIFRGSMVHLRVVYYASPEPRTYIFIGS